VDRGHVESLIGSDTFAAFWWGEVERTVRPVLVVVRGVDTQDSVKVSASDDEDAIEAVAADRPHPTLGECVRVRRSDRSPDHLDPSERKTSSKSRLNFVSRAWISRP
jgi:hypothetical protein